jgi:hypothetical protein
MEGVLAQGLERKLLNALKMRGAEFSKTVNSDKFDGHTETWTRSSLNVGSIKQLLDWVYGDESV